MTKLSLKIFLFCFLSLVLVSSFVIRSYKLGSYPSTLNGDEAALGYNAYSLLKMGKDEHGVSWPINFESFGDWKLGGYIYTLIPFIYFLGLSDTVVRLPSFLAGFINIIFSSLIFLHILKQAKIKQAKRIALISFFLFSFNPWALHLSHIAYEVNLATSFFLLGFWLLLIILENKYKPWLLLLSSLFFMASFLTYHSYQLFLPLFVLDLLFFKKKTAKKFIKNNFKFFFVTLLVGLVFIFFYFFKDSFAANNTKLSGLFIFDKNAYTQTLDQRRNLMPNRNSLLAKFYANSYIFEINRLIKNLSKNYSADYLFLSSNGHGIHDVMDLGKFYLIELPFIILALYLFLVKRKKWQQFILWWAFLASFPAIITFESIHGTRYSLIIVPLTYLSAYGFNFILNAIKNLRLKLLFFLSIFVIYLLSVLHFLISYYVIWPKINRDDWHWHNKTIVKLLPKYQAQYDKIIMSEQYQTPYIYYLFYSKYNPNKLAENLERYDIRPDGLHYVKRVENVYFTDLDFNIAEQENKKTLYILREKDLPLGRMRKNNYRIINEINNQYSKTRYYFLEFNPYVQNK